MLPSSSRPVRAVAASLLVLVLAGCGRQTRGGLSREHRFYTARDLSGFVLRREEAPEGTELREDASGQYDLERLWPTSCCLEVQEQFDEAEFQTARVSLFERPGHSADPVDTRPGWELVSSSAVLFLTDEGAAMAMDAWIDYHRSPVLDPVDVRGLGDSAVGLTGSPAAPAEQLFLYVWRRGRLLLSLRASAGAGTVPVEQVRRLVDRMDDRAS
jgi:hypothetical protein